MRKLQQAVSVNRIYVIFNDVIAKFYSQTKIFTKPNKKNKVYSHAYLRSEILGRSKYDLLATTFKHAQDPSGINFDRISLIGIWAPRLISITGILTVRNISVNLERLTYSPSQFARDKANQTRSDERCERFTA